MAADEERLPGPAGLDVCGLQIIDYGGRGHTATLDLHKKNEVLLKSKFRILLTLAAVLCFCFVKPRLKSGSFKFIDILFIQIQKTWACK